MAVKKLNFNYGTQLDSKGLEQLHKLTIMEQVES